MNCAINPPCGDCPRCRAEERIQHAQEAFLQTVKLSLLHKGRSPTLAQAIAERTLRREIYRELRWD